MSRKRMSGNQKVLPQGALIEFIVQGSYVKVSAVDPVTYVEVSIVGDPAVGERMLTQQAVRKLERMVFKRRYDKNTLSKMQDQTVPRTRRQETPSGWDV